MKEENKIYSFRDNENHKLEDDNESQKERDCSENQINKENNNFPEIKTVDNIEGNNDNGNRETINFTQENIFKSNENDKKDLENLSPQKISENNLIPYSSTLTYYEEGQKIVGSPNIMLLYKVKKSIQKNTKGTHIFQYDQQNKSNFTMNQGSTPLLKEKINSKNEVAKSPNKDNQNLNKKEDEKNSIIQPDIPIKKFSNALLNQKYKNSEKDNKKNSIISFEENLKCSKSCNSCNII